MKTAILLVAYGSSHPGGRAELQFFENLCRLSFPGYPLRWAFSSATLRSRLAESRQKSDSIDKAIMRLHFENFKAVAIQPLQTISGREHEAVIESARLASCATGMKCVTGLPLLSDRNSISRVAEALLQAIPAKRESNEDVIFMGHGAKHKAARAYLELASEMAKLDGRVHIGAMSGPLLLEDILVKLNSERVWLFPLLSVVGNHALRDMAGEQPGSWKSRIEKNGHACIPVIQGMSSCENVARIWLDNLAKILPELDPA